MFHNRTSIQSLVAGLFVFSFAFAGQAEQKTASLLQPQSAVPEHSKDLEIESAEVTYLKSLDLLVFEIKVTGKAGHTVPTARGELNGAPVLGYVFPTTLDSTDVGFREAPGVMALAVTTHPDFDDTPLWDENNDRNYANDGIVFHPHWVLLEPNKQVKGGLAVGQIDSADMTTALPPTNPGMPMYMDSPGFAVLTQGNTLKVLVPAQRLNHRKDFRFDAVAAYMEVNTSPNAPMLGVYEVYSVLSGDLSLPSTITMKP